jgi:hypothetical protein
VKPTLSLVAGVLLGSCANLSEPERVCTLIGCTDGLAIEVNHSLQQSFTVNVRSGTQTIHTFRCDPGQPCRAFVSNQTPSDVTVTVDSPQGPVSKDFQPEYRLSRPNGPDCLPECKQATIALTVT